MRLPPTDRTSSASRSAANVSSPPDDTRRGATLFAVMAGAGLNASGFEADDHHPWLLAPSGRSWRYFMQRPEGHFRLTEPNGEYRDFDANGRELPTDDTQSAFPEYLIQLDQAGPHKAVTTLPPNVIGLPKVRAAAKERALARGLSWTDKEGGGVYVYHRPTLERILAQSRTALVAAGIPHDAEGFMRHIAERHVSDPAAGQVIRLVHTRRPEGHIPGDVNEL